MIKTIRKHTKLPIIYDHQKAGTDIPDMGAKFMEACKGFDAVILFPQAGPDTEKAWIKAAQDAKMHVIIGGEMTHSGYLNETGGFLENNAPARIYEIAASMGVSEFVVPGNTDKSCNTKLIEKRLKSQCFILRRCARRKDNGSCKKLDRWHAIISKAIYEAKT